MRKGGKKRQQQQHQQEAWEDVEKNYELFLYRSSVLFFRNAFFPSIPRYILIYNNWGAKNVSPLAQFIVEEFLEFFSSALITFEKWARFFRKKMYKKRHDESVWAVGERVEVGCLVENKAVTRDRCNAALWSYRAVFDQNFSHSLHLSIFISSQQKWTVNTEDKKSIANLCTFLAVAQLDMKEEKKTVDDDEMRKKFHCFLRGIFHLQFFSSVFPPLPFSLCCLSCARYMDAMGWRVSGKKTPVTFFLHIRLLPLLPL